MNRSFFNAKTIVMAATLLALSSYCLAASPPPPDEGTTSTAYTEGVPGGVVTNTIEMSARVTAIDQASRTATLLRPDGTSVTVKAGPGVINFDQIGAGDLVNLSVIEEIAVYPLDANAPEAEQSTAVLARAPKGAAPGGLITDTRQTVATVSAIDRENRTATLHFKNGSEQTFVVRSDINLAQHEVGEKIVFEITEMLVIDVSKQQ
jgi:hypothetical protein